MSRERSPEQSALLGLAVALCAMLSASCSDLTHHTSVALHSRRPPSPELFDQLVAATRANGNEILLVQPNRRRFAARARYTDEFGRYVIAVEVSPHGLISVTPVGPRAERHEGRWIVPSRLHDEMAQLEIAIVGVANGGG